MTKPNHTAHADATLQHLRTAAPESLLVLEDGRGETAL
jgi:hypothetical protein